MKLVKEYYMKIFYKSKKIMKETDINEKKVVIPIFERDPFMFDNIAIKAEMIGFQLLDNDITIIGEQMTKRCSNISPVYYYGTRYVGDQISKFLPSNTYCQENEIHSIIVCDCGVVVLNPHSSSLTLDELRKEQKSKEKRKEL